MRWPLFLVLVLIGLVLEISLRSALTLPSLGRISPSFVAPLVVFVALSAPRMTALWACWITGLMMDLCAPPPFYSAGAHLIGPWSLGLVLAGFIVVQMRTMVFRRHVVTIVFLTVLAMVSVGVVTVTLYTVRSWYETDLRGAFNPLVELIRWTGIALYSGLLAVVLGWLLSLSQPLWSFPGKR